MAEARRAQAVKTAFIGAGVMFSLSVLIIGATLGIDYKTDASIFDKILNDKFDEQDVKGIALLFALALIVIGVILIGVGVRNQRGLLPQHTNNETGDPEFPQATVVTVSQMRIFTQNDKNDETSTETSTESSTESLPNPS